MEQTDFWTQLTNRAYWQVILALIVAFATSYANNVFLSRRNKRHLLIEAISDFHRYGYELQQIVSNRLQSEALVEFYSELSRITKDPMYVEQQKIEVNNMPVLSLEVSKAYGNLYKTIAILEQQLPSQDTKKLEQYFNNLRDYNLFLIPKLVANSEDDARKYWEETARGISLWIHKNIKSNTSSAYKVLAKKDSGQWLKKVKDFRLKIKHGT